MEGVIFRGRGMAGNTSLVAASGCAAAVRRGGYRACGLESRSASGALRVPLVAPGADQPLDIRLHQDLQHRLSHGSQEVAFCGVLKQFDQWQSFVPVNSSPGIWPSGSCGGGSFRQGFSAETLHPAALAAWASAWCLNNRGRFKSALRSETIREASDEGPLAGKRGLTPYHNVW